MHSIRKTAAHSLALSASLGLLLAACARAPEPEPVPPAAEPAETAPATDAAPDGPEAAVAAPAPTAIPDMADDSQTADLTTTCNADGIQAMIGKQATDTLVAQATADSGSANVRVLRPGDAATMDFRGDRLTITTDDGGRIQSLSCG